MDGNPVHQSQAFALLDLLAETLGYIADNWDTDDEDPASTCYYAACEYSPDVVAARIAAKVKEVTHG